MLGPIPGKIEFEYLFYFPKFAAGRKSGQNLLVSGFRKIILETLRQVKSKRIIWRLDRTPEKLPRSSSWSCNDTNLQEDEFRVWSRLVFQSWYYFLPSWAKLVFPQLFVDKVELIIWPLSIYRRNSVKRGNIPGQGCGCKDSWIAWWFSLFNLSLENTESLNQSPTLLSAQLSHCRTLKNLGCLPRHWELSGWLPNRIRKPSGHDFWLSCSRTGWTIEPDKRNEIRRFPSGRGQNTILKLQKVCTLCTARLGAKRGYEKLQDNSASPKSFIIQAQF